MFVKVPDPLRNGDRVMDQNGRYKVALTACSDPLSKGRVWEVGNLAGLLEEAGLEVVNVSDPVSSGSVMRHPRQKAQLLMDCFRDPQMDYIFDVSGGDLANTVLPSAPVACDISSAMPYFM